MAYQVSFEKTSCYHIKLSATEPYLLCKENLVPQKRFLLADTMTQIGSRDMLIASLSLIRDDASPPIPHSIIENLEKVFVERRPVGNSGNTYTLEPQSANEIRNYIFAMALSDAARKQSALKILGQIESWRLEYGRPINEPRHPDIVSGIPWPPTG